MAVGNPVMQRMLSERRAALGLPVRDPQESDPTRQQPSNPTDYFENILIFIVSLITTENMTNFTAVEGVENLSDAAWLQNHGLYTLDGYHQQSRGYQMYCPVLVHQLKTHKDQST
ncbi:hypothetical protein YC2023_019983 [Brassica napus]